MHASFSDKKENSGTAPASVDFACFSRTLDYNSSSIFDKEVSHETL